MGGYATATLTPTPKPEITMATPQNENQMRRRTDARHSRPAQPHAQEIADIDHMLPAALRIGGAKKTTEKQVQIKRVRAHTAAQMRARRKKPMTLAREDRAADIVQPAETMSTYLEKKKPRRQVRRAKGTSAVGGQETSELYDNETIKPTRKRRAYTRKPTTPDDRQEVRNRRSGKLPKLPEGLRTHIYMDLVQHQACRRIAHEAGTNISQVVRAALTYYLAQVLAPSGRGPRLKFLR